MEIRFLLGPAGSGKTHRCLAEIRRALSADPEGPPLLLLAPKQSTFQLERQLLADSQITGWTRLQILSFERLARMVLSEGGPVDLLDEEGRVMVLRALLRWHQPSLRLFRSSARMMGFAREVSDMLRELQRQRVSPERLEAMAAELPPDQSALAGKLQDLALLARTYREWLREHRLLDADLLPELAADRLRAAGDSAAFGGVWLDGFAEMTPQEIELLAAVVRVSRVATLAFCVDQEFREDPPWLSTWAVVGQTARRCRARLAALDGCEFSVEMLSRDAERGRFRASAALGFLEATWTRPCEAEGAARSAASGSLRMVACADFEREVEVAAREVLRHVRAGGRFRDVAVIVRSLDDGAAVLRRVFLRYEIPFFIDRREPLAHHPLAELTRCGLRMAAFPPRHEDWFGALKTGLLGVSGEWVDAWENAALAGGWAGEVWLRSPPAGGPPDVVQKEQAAAIAAPFRTLREALAGEPDAFEVGAALRQFWDGTGVRARLEEWASADGESGGQLELLARIHGTAWEQVNTWLKALERGFETTRMPATEWLAIVEAGLSTMTAGVIPPSQDQVMIGAVDRSRQPELRLALVLGLNEGTFPSPPRGGGILVERERDRLAALGIGLESDRRRRVGQERYLGYVACTRSGGRLVLTWSERDETGRPRNPSPFVAHVQSVFPEVPVETDVDEAVGVRSTAAEVAVRAEHRSELLPWLFARREATEFDGWVGDAIWRSRLRDARGREVEERLSPAWIRALYGGSPEVSVSGLESLAACPFQFFVKRGLRGRERERFEVDRRHTGSLAHELLARFHQSIAAEGRRWRDLTPAEARSRLVSVAALYCSGYGGGVFAATPEARWEADAVVERLTDLVGILVDWMTDYRFDPLLVEVEFGGESEVGAWCVDAGGGRMLRIRGKVDRVDVCRGETGQARYVVLDYKWSARRLDERLVRAGIDLQIVTYALALADVLDWERVTGCSWAELAAFCYVGLGGGAERVASRMDLVPVEESLRARHRHRGRLRLESAPWLDGRTPADTSGQFLLKFKKDGTPSKVGDGRPGEDFEALLESTRDVVRGLGIRLFEGDVAVSPYRLGSRKACDQCDYLAVCRFDAWTQSYRKVG